MRAPLEVDFDLRGAARVRLVDFSPAEARRFARWSGTEPVPARDGEPDLVLVATAAAAGPGAIVVPAGRGRSAAVPFDRIGRGGEVRCSGGLPAPSLLRPLVNLTVMTRGLLPLHAAGFQLGRGFLVLGASGSGKTAALLAALERGAAFLCAEWAFVDLARSEIRGAPEPVRVRWKHLGSRLALRARLSGATRLRLRLFGSSAAALETLPPTRALGRRLARRAYSDVSPAHLSDIPPAARAPLGGLLLLAANATGAVSSTLAPDPAARKLATFAAADYASLIPSYRSFRSAFPGRAQPLLDALEPELERRLRRALAGTPVLRLSSPGGVGPGRIEAWLAQLSESEGGGGGGAVGATR